LLSEDFASRFDDFKKVEPRGVEQKFMLNGRIELTFYVHTGSNLTTFGRLKLIAN
jgi:hypothetical protein